MWDLSSVARKGWRISGGRENGTGGVGGVGALVVDGDLVGRFDVGFTMVVGGVMTLYSLFRIRCGSGASIG